MLFLEFFWWSEDYFQEADSQFRYLALELCIATLNDYVEEERVREKVQISKVELLRQATEGLAHLHSIQIGRSSFKVFEDAVSIFSPYEIMNEIFSPFSNSPFLDFSIDFVIFSLGSLYFRAILTFSAPRHEAPKRSDFRGQPERRGSSRHLRLWSLQANSTGQTLAQQRACIWIGWDRWMDCAGGTRFWEHGSNIFF